MAYFSEESHAISGRKPNVRNNAQIEGSLCCREPNNAKNDAKRPKIDRSLSCCKIKP
jgi:hypothetical protein